jgi:hypothetical protein
MSKAYEIVGDFLIRKQKVTARFQASAAEVYQNCVLLGYYAASSGNSLLTFRDNLTVAPTQWARNVSTELPLLAL